VSNNLRGGIKTVLSEIILDWQIACKLFIRNPRLIFFKRDLLRGGKNCEPAAKIGVARLNSFPQKRRREEVEEAQQESVDGPPLDVFI
jgi:hypothetical protein